MFSKTWRVHKIFTNKKIQRMVRSTAEYMYTLDVDNKIAIFNSKIILEQRNLAHEIYLLLLFTVMKCYRSPLIKRKNIEAI